MIENVKFLHQTYLDFLCISPIIENQRSNKQFKNGRLPAFDNNRSSFECFPPHTSRLSAFNRTSQRKLSSNPIVIFNREITMIFTISIMFVCVLFLSVSLYTVGKYRHRAKSNRAIPRETMRRWGHNDGNDDGIVADDAFATLFGSLWLHATFN
jgi:hypothetical protein